MNAQSQLMQEFLEARPMAVVGASPDRSKYGNIILRNLRDRGWEVFAVNPKGGTIEDQPAYPSLADCPQRPALAVMVTPPAVTLQVLPQAAEAGVARIWFQDGSFDDQVLALAESLCLQSVHDACIMVMAARLAE